MGDEKGQVYLQPDQVDGDRKRVLKRQSSGEG